MQKFENIDQQNYHQINQMAPEETVGLFIEIGIKQGTVMIWDIVEG